MRSRNCGLGKPQFRQVTTKQSTECKESLVSYQALMDVISQLHQTDFTVVVKKVEFSITFHVNSLSKLVQWICI